MKSFALALCILVLAVTIQDISARPHRRGPQGQRGQVQRGQDQRDRGQRDQGPRGQDQRDHGQRGPLGGKHGICRVLNFTTLDVLCDNSTRCPNYTECSPPPADITQPPPTSDLLIHSCIPKVCNPEDPNSCPNGTNCSSSLIGTESRCIPNDRHQRRKFESSEESDEDIEDNEVDSEEDEDTLSCRDFFREAIRREVSSHGPGGRGRGPAGNGGFGQGQGQGGNGQNSPFGVGSLRQAQGVLSQGQMINGGLGQEPEGNDALDTEEDDSSSSEEVSRGNRRNRGNRPSAGVP